jgi:hypothetical protein
MPCRKPLPMASFASGSTYPSDMQPISLAGGVRPEWLVGSEGDHQEELALDAMIC